MGDAGNIRAGRAFVEIAGDDRMLAEALKTSEAKMQAWAAKLAQLDASGGHGRMNIRGAMLDAEKQSAAIRSQISDRSRLIALSERQARIDAAAAGDSLQKRYADFKLRASVRGGEWEANESSVRSQMGEAARVAQVRNAWAVRTEAADQARLATQRLLLAEIEETGVAVHAAGAATQLGNARTGALGTLKSLFGKGSELTLLTKTLMGGGAVMALKLMADGFERLGAAVETAAKQLREGKLTISEAIEKLNDVHPVAGPAYKGLSSLKRAVTGEQSKEDYAAEVEAEYQRLNKAYEHAEEIHKEALLAEQKAEEDSADAFKNAVDEKYKALNDEYERLEQIHRDGLQAEQTVRDDAGDKAKAKEKEVVEAAQKAWDDYWRNRLEQTEAHEGQIKTDEEKAKRDADVRGDANARNRQSAEEAGIRLKFAGDRIGMEMALLKLREKAALEEGRRQGADLNIIRERFRKERELLELEKWLASEDARKKFTTSGGYVRGVSLNQALGGGTSVSPIVRAITKTNELLAQIAKSLPITVGN